MPRLGQGLGGAANRKLDVREGCYNPSARPTGSQPVFASIRGGARRVRLRTHYIDVHHAVPYTFCMSEFVCLERC